nr:hypothetical protein [uncultured Desulfobulbus sp.]
MSIRRGFDFPVRNNPHREWHSSMPLNYFIEDNLPQFAEDLPSERSYW